MSTAIQINDILPKQQYVATSGQTLFSYNFPIQSASDLQVFRTPANHAPDDAAQELAFNSDYTVSGVGAQAGGSITMLIAINAGDRITLQRSMPYQRLSSYTSGRLFNPENLDADFNSIVMMMQQIHAYYEKRFVHYENTVVDDTSNLRLPTLANGQFWRRGPGGIAAVNFEENPDASTLRSELANNSLGTDGARIVGYQDAVIGSTTMHGAIQTYIGMYGDDVGVLNHPVIEVEGFIGYRKGMKVLVKIAHDNANEDVTLNINYTGPKNVRLQSNEGLPPRTIITGMIAEFVYDGEKFILMNPFESHSDFRTGDFKFTSHSDAEPGWIWCNDGTIGGPASSATALKSDLARALFIHLWNTYDNTVAPVAEGRGANAEADWLANKQIQLGHIAGRVLAAAGQGIGLTLRSNGALFGEESHVITGDELASHGHNWPFSPMNGTEAGSGSFSVGAGSSQQTSTSGGNQSHNNIQPTAWVNVFLKL